MSAQVALYDALAAVTVCDVAWWQKYGPHVDRGFRLDFRADEVAVVADLRRPTKHMRTGIYSAAGLRYPSPADALEALHTRALWPFAAEGDGAVRWWAMGRCGMCGGRGGASGNCPWCNDRGMAVTSVPTAPTISALVAVASLGAPALLRAASLAEDIARAAGHPKARLTWRVMTRAAREDRRHEVFYTGAVAERVAALTHAEDGTATGVHLVGLDAGAVTLAVEAVGSP